MNTMKIFLNSITSVTFFLFGFIQLTGCENSGSPVSESDELSDDVSTVQRVNKADATDPIPDNDTITCLDISFIEKLETGLESGYKDTRLIKQGFEKVSSRKIENGKEMIFENHQKNRLKISKSVYTDGETTFKVEYLIDSSQLKCMENQLKQNNYTIDEGDYHLRYDKYLKKGLGSYEKKRMTIDSEKSTVTYIHIIGKELSVAPALNLETE